AVLGLNARSMSENARTPKYSSTTRALTIAPLRVAATRNVLNRTVDVTASTVTNNTPKLMTKRPTMWTAFALYSGAATAASAITTRTTPAAGIMAVGLTRSDLTRLV